MIIITQILICLAGCDAFEIDGYGLKFAHLGFTALVERRNVHQRQVTPDLNFRPPQIIPIPGVTCRHFVEWFSALAPMYTLRKIK